MPEELWIKTRGGGVRYHRGTPCLLCSLGTDRTVLPHVIDRALLFLVPLYYFIRPPIDSLESVH